jgi:hypothetical protein
MIDCSGTIGAICSGCALGTSSGDIVPVMIDGDGGTSISVDALGTRGRSTDQHHWHDLL